MPPPAPPFWSTLVPLLVWPAAIVVLVIGLALIFKASIAGFIGRAFKWKVGPLEVEGQKTQAQAQEKAPEILKGDGEDWRDSRLKAETDQHEREKILVRLLASSRLSFLFKWIYRNIFGSQLGALRFLQGQALPVKTDMLRPYFEEHERRVAGAFPTDVGAWVDFMVRSRLVDAEGDQLGLSLVGKEFLKHLIDMRHPDEKQY